MSKKEDDRGTIHYQAETQFQEPPLMVFVHRILLRKRTIVESVIDQLKNVSQIKHSRHRSAVNFLANLFVGSLLSSSA